jgi:uncharacterized protein YjbJ (UPF0337 family)
LGSGAPLAPRGSAADGTRRSCREPISIEEYAMNWDRIEGNWRQIKGKAKQQWGKLTDDDLDVIAGKKDELLGKIQERHGIAKDEAERQLDDWTARI